MSAIRLILAVHAAVLGGGYLLGPPHWYSSTTFIVVRSLMPVPWWGAAFLVVAALLAAGKTTTGHALGLAVFAFWGAALAATISTAELTGWGSPVHNLLLAVPMHARELWRLRQSRVDARAGRT